MVASKFLAEAATRSGYHAQSFASYGALRRGGKVESYVRISEKAVRPHCKLYEPDCLVLMDEVFVQDASALSGLKSSGSILINSGKVPWDFSGLAEFKVHAVDAYRIAKENGLLLPGGMPAINTALLGALTALLDLIPLGELASVIHEQTPKPELNVACAEKGYERVISMSGQGGLGRDMLGNAKKKDESTTGPYPVYDLERMNKCHRCQICYMVCPSLAITFLSAPFTLSVMQSVCTRCGICIQECPRNAIFWGGGGRD